MLLIASIIVVILAILAALRNIAFGRDIGARGLRWYQRVYGENDLKDRRLSDLFRAKAELCGPDTVLIFQPTLRRYLPIVDLAYLEYIRRLLVDNLVDVAVIGTWKPDADKVENDDLFGEFRANVDHWMGNVASRVEVVNLWERGGSLLLDNYLFTDLKTYVSPKTLAEGAAALEKRRKGPTYRVRATLGYQTLRLAAKPSHNARIVKRMVVNLIGSRMVEQHLRYRGWIPAPEPDPDTVGDDNSGLPPIYKDDRSADKDVDVPIIYLAWELEFSRESTLERLTQYRLRSTMLMGETISFGLLRTPLPVEDADGAVCLVGPRSHLKKLDKRELTCADRLLSVIIESVRESGFAISEARLAEIEALRDRADRIDAKCALLNERFLRRDLQPSGVNR